MKEPPSLRAVLHFILFMIKSLIKVLLLRNLLDTSNNVDTQYLATTYSNSSISSSEISIQCVSVDIISENTSLYLFNISVLSSDETESKRPS